MTEYGTIKIPIDEYEEHNARRKSLGQTWAEYIDGEAADPMTVGDAMGIADAVIEELEADTGPVKLEATEYNKIADEIVERLR